MGMKQKRCITKHFVTHFSVCI